MSDKTCIERVEEKLDLCLELLTGNGDPAKGLIVKVDRLVQSEQNRKWWTRTAAGAAVGAVVTSIAAFFRGG